MVVVRQFAPTNNGILSGTDSELDTTSKENDAQMKKDEEEKKLHRMDKVHNFLVMWQGSPDLHATQKKSCSQNKQITALGFNSDKEEIIKASWSLIQHQSEAAFNLSERSRLPPALSVKNLLGGRTEIWNAHWIRTINRHPVESDEDSSPDTILDTDDWLNWNGNMDNPNDSEEDCVADEESVIGHYNGIDAAECPEQQDVNNTPTVPGLDRLTRKSPRQAVKVSVTVNAVETRRNKGGKKK